jgi:hypothetical protein
MKRYRVSAVVGAGLLCLGAAGACSDQPSSPTVPRLSAGADSGDTANPNAVAGDSSAERRARLHAAAQCIRDHGAPRYQDPVLTAEGHVYTDDVGLREVAEAQLTAIDTACRDLIRAAGFSMRDQGPPPPKLIQAGVRSAQCLRANGLPDVEDPTVARRFTPGKGFGLDPGELPAAGKQDPTVRRALQACRAILDEEARVSSLGNLGDA